MCRFPKAHQWFKQIKAGKTHLKVAMIEGITNSRLSQLIDLAFLAPDIFRDVIRGKQPVGFTSDWCLRHPLPADWTERRQLLAAL